MSAKVLFGTALAVGAMILTLTLWPGNRESNTAAPLNKATAQNMKMAEATPVTDATAAAERVHRKLTGMEASGDLSAEDASRFDKRFNELTKHHSSSDNINLANALRELDQQIDQRSRSRNLAGRWFNWY